MGAVEEAAAVTPVALDEVKAYLRLEAGDEDALLVGLIHSATGLCERFVGRALIAREAEEVVPASSAWRRLTVTPVVSVGAVEAIGQDGAGEALAVEHYAIDIDANGDGWVRVTTPDDFARVRVTYVAGMGSDWNAVPEALRQGIVRLTTHLFTHRDGAEDTGPPAAVAALWRPWRRMRLS
ncbi:MAG: phage head-tail connector protein [Sphingomonadaceae bacterium]|nr:phage head-tail connector protein [Sphingomonadaceae bacterium]